MERRDLTVLMAVGLIVSTVSYFLLLATGTPPITPDWLRKPIEVSLFLLVATMFCLTGFFSASGALRQILVLAGAWLFLLFLLEWPLLPGRIAGMIVAVLALSATIAILVTNRRLKRSH